MCSHPRRPAAIAPPRAPPHGKLVLPSPFSPYCPSPGTFLSMPSFKINLAPRPPIAKKRCTLLTQILPDRQPAQVLRKRKEQMRDGAGMAHDPLLQEEWNCILRYQDALASENAIKKAQLFAERQLQAKVRTVPPCILTFLFFVFGSFDLSFVSTDAASFPFYTFPFAK